MSEFFDHAKARSGKLTTATATTIAATAKELRPAPGDFKRASNFVVDTTGKSDWTRAVGKDAMKTRMAKDAAAGAAIGAVIAVPVPFIGPVAGAVIGAGLAVSKNIINPSRPPDEEATPRLIPAHTIEVETKLVPPPDRFEELHKLHDLKVKGVLTEEEFAAEKKKILDR